MKVQQANLLLEKINNLHKSIHLDGEVSSIERDLMMSYIRQFYESYMESEIAPVAKMVKKSAPKVVHVPKPEPKVVEKVVAPTPKPEPKPVVQEVPKVVEVAPPAPVAKPVAIASKPQPEPVSIPAATKEVSTASPAVEALFRHQAATELSEKLSQQNITDLTRALSINDKLLYANELFDRDMPSMNSMLAKLNTLSSMEVAKGVLIKIAEKNNWGESERAEVAESFIKLVRRRY